MILSTVGMPEHKGLYVCISQRYSLKDYTENINPVTVESIVRRSHTLSKNREVDGVPWILSSDYRTQTTSVPAMQGYLSTVVHYHMNAALGSCLILWCQQLFVIFGKLSSCPRLAVQPGWAYGDADIWEFAGMIFWEGETWCCPEKWPGGEAAVPTQGALETSLLYLCVNLVPFPLFFAHSFNRTLVGVKMEMKNTLIHQCHLLESQLFHCSSLWK